MTSRTATKPKSVVLVGFMAAGKSTIGPLLAGRLKLPFFDTDREVERALGMSVSDVFRSAGEQCFRRAEHKTIVELLEGSAKVIAAGGGAFIDLRLRGELLERTRTVWLDPPFEIIRTRLEHLSDRPVAAGRTHEQLRELWTQRRASYAHAALHIAPEREDPERVVDNILEKLRAH